MTFYNTPIPNFTSTLRSKTNTTQIETTHCGMRCFIANHIKIEHRSQVFKSVSFPVPSLEIFVTDVKGTKGGRYNLCFNT